MSKQSTYHLDIFIDHLTDSIREVNSGKSFATEVLEISIEDLKSIMKKTGWHFNWKFEYKIHSRKVYKLVIVDQPDVIQGLVSISDMGDHFYLHLAESAPINFGVNKKHEGVGGNLFAFVVSNHVTMETMVLSHSNQKQVS